MPSRSILKTNHKEQQQPIQQPIRYNDPGEQFWEKKTIHSFIPYLSGYYTLSLINFLHSL